jgi:hypothetical protein
MARTLTRQDVALLVIGTVYDTIKESGDNGIPSGHLYSALTGHMDLETYQRIIDILKRTGKVSESGYLLTAI